MLKPIYTLKTKCFSWSKLLSYICNSDGSLILMAHGDKLKDKEKAAIKEKFAVKFKKVFVITLIYLINFRDLTVKWMKL